MEVSTSHWPPESTVQDSRQEDTLNRSRIFERILRAEQLVTSGKEDSLENQKRAMIQARLWDEPDENPSPPAAKQGPKSTSHGDLSFQVNTPEDCNVVDQSPKTPLSVTTTLSQPLPNGLLPTLALRSPEPSSQLTQRQGPGNSFYTSSNRSGEKVQILCRVQQTHVENIRLREELPRMKEGYISLQQGAAQLRNDMAKLMLKHDAMMQANQLLEAEKQKAEEGNERTQVELRQTREEASQLANLATTLCEEKKTLQFEYNNLVKMYAVDTQKHDSLALRLQELLNERDILKQIHETHLNERDRLVNERDQVVKEIEETSQVRDILLVEQSKWKVDLQSLEEERAHQRALVEDLQGQLVKLKLEKEEVIKENIRLQDAWKMCQQEVVTCLDDKEKLGQRNDELQRQLDEWKATASNARDEKEALAERYKDAEKMLVQGKEELQMKSRGLENQLEDLQREQVTWYAEMEALREENSLLKADCLDLANGMSAANSEMEMLRQQVETLGQVVESTKADKAETEKKIVLTLTMLQQIEDERNALRDQVKTLRLQCEKSDESITSATSQIASLNQQVDQLQEDKRNLESIKINLRKENQAYQADLTCWENVKVRLEMETKHLTGLLEKERVANHSLRQERRDLQETIDKLRKEHNTLAADKDEVKTQHEASIKSLRSQLSTAEAEVTKLQNALQGVSAELLQQKLTSSAENEQLSSQLRETIETTNKIIEAVRVLKDKEVGDLNEALLEARNHLELLRKEPSDTKLQREVEHAKSLLEEERTKWKTERRRLEAERRQLLVSLQEAQVKSHACVSPKPSYCLQRDPAVDIAQEGMVEGVLSIPSSTDCPVVRPSSRETSLKSIDTAIRGEGLAWAASNTTRHPPPSLAVPCDSDPGPRDGETTMNLSPTLASKALAAATTRAELAESEVERLEMEAESHVQYIAELELALYERGATPTKPHLTHGSGGNQVTDNIIPDEQSGGTNAEQETKEMHLMYTEDVESKIATLILALEEKDLQLARLKNQVAVAEGLATHVAEIQRSVLKEVSTKNVSDRGIPDSPGLPQWYHDNDGNNDDNDDDVDEDQGIQVIHDHDQSEKEIEDRKEDDAQEAEGGVEETRSLRFGEDGITGDKGDEGDRVHRNDLHKLQGGQLRSLEEEAVGGNAKVEEKDKEQGKEEGGRAGGRGQSLPSQEHDSLYPAHVRSQSSHSPPSVSHHKQFPEPDPFAFPPSPHRMALPTTTPHAPTSGRWSASVMALADAVGLSHSVVQDTAVTLRLARRKSSLSTPT